MPAKLNTLITTLVAQHIDEPTHEMRVAFRKLPFAHKWLLYTILEAGDRPSFFSSREDLKNLEARYDTLCPSTCHRLFSAVLDETTEGFVQIVRVQGAPVGVTWIHPSCQDLTIEELATSAEDRQRFLSLCTRDGIEKAMSVAGGSEGKRIFPLLITDDDWSCLKDRCENLLRAKVEVAGLLLRSLSSLKFLTPKPEAQIIDKFTATIVALWPVYLASIRRQPCRSWACLHIYFGMRRAAKANARPPFLASVWKGAVEDVVEAMDEDRAIEEAGHSLKEFYQVVDVLSQNEPNFWAKPSINKLYRSALDCISARAQQEIDTFYDNFGRFAKLGG